MQEAPNQATAMEVLTRHQSFSVPMEYTASHRPLIRSRSLPVQVLQTKRRASIDRLNRDLRQSLQIQLTSTLMTSESAPGKKNGIRFDPSILMQVAVTNGEEPEIAKLISEHGKGIVDLKEPTGLPPVMRAIFEGQVNSLQLLIQAGADLGAHDPEDWNVLHVAAAMDDYDAVEVILSSLSPRKSIVLLEEGNTCGQKPVELAEEEEMITFLEETLSNLKSLC